MLWESPTTVVHKHAITISLNHEVDGWFSQPDNLRTKSNTLWWYRRIRTSYCQRFGSFVDQSRNVSISNAIRDHFFSLFCREPKFLIGQLQKWAPIRNQKKRNSLKLEKHFQNSELNNNFKKEEYSMHLYIPVNDLY